MPEDNNRDPKELILKVENLHCSYGKKEILRGVNLDIKSDEVVAVIGPNGAGKSTILKAIMGLLRISRGRVLLKGRDLVGLAPHRRVREGLAYLMQGNAIFPSLNAADHLTLARVASVRTMPLGRPPINAREGWALPAELVVKPGPAGLFSGGERHSLALATILALGPQILLCDEPSAGLSPSIAKEAFKKITNLGLPVLCWVEQRIAEVLPLSNRAILLLDGQNAAETDNPSEWLSGNVLYELTLRKKSHG